MDGGGDAKAEGRQLADLVGFLKRNRVIADYGQVTLLLHSVKGAAAVGYLDALERAGIPVNRAPAGSRGRRHAGDRHALTVTTIHQAKGGEWDVVITGSLDFDNVYVGPVGRELQPYCRRPPFEPGDRIASFDHARQHYVAFSRPRGLLVLTSAGSVHPRFNPIWEDVSRWTEMDPTALATLARQRFRTVEDDIGSERAAAAKPQRKIYRFNRLDLHIGGRRRAGASPTNPDGAPGRA